YFSPRTAAGHCVLSRIGPGVFESFCELPKRAIKRRGNAHFFAPVCNCPVHEIHFGLAFGENVLKHARFVSAGSIGAFFHESARIAVQNDSQRLRDGFTFGNESAKKCSGRWKARGRAVMQQGEGADGIRRSIENELGPLCAAGVLQRDHAQTGAVEKFCELLDWRVRRVCWLKRANPGITVDVKTDVARLDNVARGKSSAANNVADMLGKNLFIADTI